MMFAPRLASRSIIVSSSTSCGSGSFSFRSDATISIGERCCSNRAQCRRERANGLEPLRAEKFFFGQFFLRDIGRKLSRARGRPAWSRISVTRQST